ncbi:hypothetical protein J5N97_002026 [Dioscorea zingiberensis]|uniref:Pyruvate kinase n=1 Tax=Dioscorea zingiberensis TaxID=325984 RepID=A0A9D5BT30_9LILI|nr:hypothetical protein J5N97_002026 [Dioscorea zingiberensis]
MSTLNVPARMSLKHDRTWTTDRLASSKSLSEFIGFEYRPKRENGQKQMFTVRSVRITQQSSGGNPSSPNGPAGGVGVNSTYEIQSDDDYEGPEVRSGDVPQPILLTEGQEFNFTIRRGVSTKRYRGMMSLAVKSKTRDSVKCVVIDGGELKSRRHLNVQKDWEDIKFGVDNGVDFYAVSFVKTAAVVHELKRLSQSCVFLAGCNADIHVIVKIESADSIPNLHSIISASDGVSIIYLGAELPIEEVPLLQEDIIRRCHSMQKPVIVATNMLESMIDHPTPTRAEVSDIAIAVREGADAIMLSGETAHGKVTVKVMHTVALRTEASLPISTIPPIQISTYKDIWGNVCFPLHNYGQQSQYTPIIAFTRTGSMAVLLSHYRPCSTIFAFTNEERIKQRLVLYHGVLPIYMQFSNDSEETFSRAIKLLVVKGHLKEGEHVTLVQSGAQPIWRPRIFSSYPSS